MENPKALNVLLLAVVIFVLGLALVFSIYYRDFSVFTLILGWLVLVAVGSGVLSLVFAIAFGPLLWLVSGLPGKKPKRKR